MPTPARRVKHKKRTKIKSSGGRTVMHYHTEKAGVPCCNNCGQKLAGMPHQGTFNISKLSRTQKTVERMNSGNLCSGCLQSLLRRAARNL